MPKENLFSKHQLEVITEKLYCYTIRRCVMDKTRFNIYGIDREGSLLFLMQDDLSFEEAAELVEILNNPSN